MPCRARHAPLHRPSSRPPSYHDNIPAIAQTPIVRVLFTATRVDAFLRGGEPVVVVV
ncbi:hypothetical protein Pint_22350 [Pistacia integerrima]|uniref:Uncharacterized protein n=1 Tax=Pistacia integerrima TaxID=434235 RepID=A0ACC0YH84_9ROSI|nr:hypothetical protein Pint_22350 [Pistacia integerrima]